MRWLLHISLYTLYKQVELLNCTHLVGASVRRYGAWLRPGQSVNQLCTGLQEMLAPFLAEGVVYRALAQRPSVASMKRSTTALQQLRAATVANSRHP